MTGIVLTGAATMTGSEVLKELLECRDVTSIQLLLPGGRSAERVHAHLGPLPASVRMIEAKLDQPHFGLSLEAWENLGALSDVVIHCAQRETQDQQLEVARRANVLPVDNLIELLERSPELRLHHLSTAFVGGTRRGLFTEFDLDCGQGFHNAFERSKFEAEKHLRESSVSGRVTIHRPSHTLARGPAVELGGASPLLAALAAASLLPGDPKARVDFVPADYVAGAIVALLRKEAEGTFHIACGWDASLPVKRAAALAAKGRGLGSGAWILPRIASWPLRLFGTATRNGLSTRRLAFTTTRDLLNQGPVFDTFRTERALDIPCPAPESWLANAVRLGEARHWAAASQL
jgi:nucleoside-diphosphate-sugar epimerase